jgi:CDP-diglyceride synthetase
VAPFGGFLASIVKRAYGKKDFSNLIAGHGGFIDRLDCQIITAPFVYLYVRRFVQPWKS